MAAKLIQSIPTFNHVCEGCDQGREILITEGTRGKVDIMFDIDAAADGVGITWSNCKAITKRKKVPIEVGQLQTTYKDQNSKAITPCWLNESYKDPRRDPEIFGTDLGPSLSPYDQLVKDITDVACADVFGATGGRNAAGDLVTECHGFLDAITATASGSATVTYIKKGGDAGTSCGNTGTVTVPINSTTSWQKSSSPDIRVKMDVKTINAAPSRTTQKLQVCTPGQLLKSGLVVARDSGKQIDVPTHVNITCQKSPALSDDGKRVKFSGTVGDAENNDTLNALFLKSDAKYRIDNLMKFLSVDIVDACNEALNQALGLCCGTPISFTASCSITVS